LRSHCRRVCLGNWVGLFMKGIIGRKLALFARLIRAMCSFEPDVGDATPQTRNVHDTREISPAEFKVITTAIQELNTVMQTVRSFLPEAVLVDLFRKHSYQCRSRSHHRRRNPEGEGGPATQKERGHVIPPLIIRSFSLTFLAAFHPFLLVFARTASRTETRRISAMNARLSPNHFSNEHTMPVVSRE